MAIIRVNIVTERASFCKVFNDEAQAIKETDSFLFENKLNDGCSLASGEDFIALNGVLAEVFDDIYNADNLAQWEDIEKELTDHLDKTVCHQDKLQPGTVSRASMRTDDIAEACIMALWSVDKDKVLEILRKELEFASAIYDKMIWHSDNSWWESEDAFLFVAEELFDIMETYAPEGYHFGNTDGDLSDFGYWPDDNHLEDFE